ncbi:MAG: acetoacetate decarboxylase family protein [Solirubrobacterales bacterium]|nr:acetoacetate decarboxylase family protein [Solirubrobacterales bacterium]MBV9799053.1 acetoacetate decarboxylase family protein [Solirubrobacterales bacterium]
MSIPGVGALRSVLESIAEPILKSISGTPDGSAVRARPGRPTYVDYGALMTPPAPFRSLNTTLWGFWASADSHRVGALCDKVFNQPTGGAVQCKPLSEYVMLSWGSIARVVPETAPYDRFGGVEEPQVAIWVPVALRDRLGVDWRFAMFIPYMWLENPMSLATGRELFGYPKSGGWPQFPPDDGPQEWKLDVFGLDYEPDALAARHPLLEVVQRDGPVEAAKADLSSLADIARHAADQLFDDPRVVGDIEVGASMVVDLFEDRLPNVFLKQFRDVRDGLGAALQQVVEADYKIGRLEASPLLREHDLTVHHLDSHPVIDELGLKDQRLGPAYRVEMDFDVGDGRVLWDASGP